MLWLILLFGLFFVGLGFLVNEGNARYLLAGYNTLSESERKKVDLSYFIPFFRRFHVFLGISFTLFGLGAYFAGGPVWANVFIGLYPILAYIYFVWKQERGSRTGSNKVALVILVVLFAGISLLLYEGFQKDVMRVSAELVQVSGLYGEKMHLETLKSVRVTAELPEITHRKNGIAAGSIKKGTFKTGDGSLVKLVVDTDVDSFLEIIRNGDAVPFYFSSPVQNNLELLEAIRRYRPEIVMD